MLYNRGMNKAWINPVNVFAVIVFTVLVSYLSYGIYQNTRPKPEVKASQVAQVTPVAKPVDVPLNADKILELVNAERAKAGVAPLISDPRLVQSAQTKADDMAANDYFGHINPVTGVNGYTLIPNGMCAYKSENIGANIDTIGNQNIIRLESWMNSKPHHDAMLDSKYTLTGVAIKEQAPTHFVAVQHFCQQ